MTTFAKTRYWLFLMSVVTAIFIYACDKDDESDSDYDADIGQSVDKMINASEGGQITTGSMTLVIPPNALPEDVVVSFGITGEEPESVPNEQLDITLQPFTIDIPVDTILKPLKVLIDLNNDSNDEELTVAGYNGSSYFPYDFESSDNGLSIEIDLLRWHTPDKAVLGPIIIFILNRKQTPPSSMMGLKEVTVSNNQLVYNTIPDVNEDSKVIIMIHGWVGSPETWTDFVPKIQSSSKVEYSNYWTYGYNSSHSIDSNGESFANLINQVSNGAHIDIVAHSMGGLVSRAALENHNAFDNVNSLITLGTPHLGSSLAVTRHIIGYIIGLTSPPDLYSYITSSQGYKDLNTGSAFINQLGNNPASAIPYHTIACVNNPDKWWLSQSWLLPGPDDGVVTVESAKSVSGATSPTNEVFIDTGNAHLAMTRNDELFDQVVAFLVHEGKPKSAFSAFPESGDAPLTVFFTDESTNNPTDWQWDFGDYSTSAEQHPQYIYQNPGIYTVKLTVENHYGTDTAVKTDYITVGDDNGDIIYGDGVTDIDGNEYVTVIIGNQEWMAENLRVTRDADGNDITRYCYDNNTANCELYGGLYTWHTIMNGQSSSSSNPSGVQGICPTGWHVPSDAQWTELLNYLDSQGLPNSNVTGGAGNALKSCRQVGSPLGGECNTSEHPRWNSHSTHYGFDEFGFSALPGGKWFNTESSFSHLGTYSNLGLSTEISSTLAGNRQLSFARGNANIGAHSKTDGISLRCVRN